MTLITDRVEKASASTFANAVMMPDVPFGVDDMTRNAIHWKYLGGIYQEDGSPVPEALLTRTNWPKEFNLKQFDSPEQVGFQAPFLTPTSEKSGTSIYAGVPSEFFGHFIVESLSRLWYAKQNPELLVVWSRRQDFSDWQKEILQVLGIQNEMLFIEEPTRFEFLVVPTPGHLFPGFFAQYYLDFLGVVTPTPKIPGKKLYVSRSQGSKRGGYTNELELESYLEMNGWTIFHPEEHPFAARFDAVSSSEIVMLTEGAFFLSLLFFTELDTRIFTLARNDDFLSHNDPFFREFFGIISKAKPLNHLRLDLPKKWRDGEDTGARFEVDLEFFRTLMNDTEFLTEPEESMDQFVDPFQWNPDHSRAIAAGALNAVDPSTTDRQTHWYHAELAARESNWETAVSEMERAVALDPSDPEGHGRLAHFLEEQGDPACAVKSLTKAIELTGEDYPAFHIGLSANYLKLHLLEAAKAEALKSIEFFPENGGLFNHLGYVLLEMGDLDGAENAQRTAARLDPELLQAHVQLFHIYMRKEMWEEAVAGLELAVQKDDTRPEFFQYLGHALLQCHDMEGAVSAFRKSISLDPENTDTYYFLSRVLTFQDKWEESMVPSKTAVRLEPANAQYLYHLATVLNQLHHFREAELSIFSAIRHRCGFWKGFRLFASIQKRRLCSFLTGKR